jgi:hypothetical protein
MATYDDLMKAGLLGPTSQRDAALMGLFSLGGQIGRRSAPRLSPTAPPLDLGAAMKAYQASMTGALQRGALSRKLRDEAKQRAMFGSRPANPQLAQLLAAQGAVVPAMGLAAGIEADRIMATPEMEDPTAFASDIDLWHGEQKRKAFPTARESEAYPAALKTETERLLPAALEATTVAPAMIGVPAGIRQFAGALADAGQYKEAAELVSKHLIRKPEKGTSQHRNYITAKNQGFAGSFMDYMMVVNMSKQGVVYTPPGGSAGAAGSVQVIPDSPAALRAERNRLMRLTLDPEQIEVRKTAEREAARKSKNVEMMPARRNAIIVKIEREPILKKTIEEIKRLSKGWTTSGLPGQLFEKFAGASSDQWELERLIGTVRSVVGLEELIRVKKAGATFGALSDTEMALLISSMGALDGLRSPGPLGKTLDIIMGLYSTGIGRAKKDFSEMYPKEPSPTRKPKRKRSSSSRSDKAILNLYAPR